MRGKRIVARDLERALDIIRQGRTVQTAAGIIGFHHGTLTRALKDTCPDEYAQALQERALSKADQVDDRMEQLANADDPAPSLVIQWARRWHPGYREKQQIEVTGQDGRPVEIEDRSASLSDVARILEAVGALAELGGPTDRPEVPADRPVLPAPLDA